MYKYIYGKWEILKGLVEGTQSLRFCDIRHYVRLENEHMRDNEEHKIFLFEPHTILLNVAGHDLNPEDFAADVNFNIPARNCYCLCLSNKKNDPELFDIFKADVCIEFNVEYLMEFLNFVFVEKMGGEVVSKNITYYTKSAGLHSLTSQEAVFTKPQNYAHEDEYRVAIFLPYDDKSIINHNGVKIPAFKKCECEAEVISAGNCKCYFMFLHNGLPNGFKPYIGEVKRKT
jgi:hypothetical protein